MEDLTEMSASELQRWDGKDWGGEPVEVAPDDLLQHVWETWAAKRGTEAADRAVRRTRWRYASGRERELQERLDLGLEVLLPRSQGRAWNNWMEEQKEMERVRRRWRRQRRLASFVFARVPFVSPDDPVKLAKQLLTAALLGAGGLALAWSRRRPPIEFLP